MLRRILTKLTSTKMWICLWSMAMVTYLIFTKQADNTTTYILATVPMAYSGLNVLQKRIVNEGIIHEKVDR